jgi:hypothetical protein
MFTEWITYPVILVLILTGVGQIRYLNRALKRFDSKVVIPIQFVLFTLSAIIGSAILYGDFKNTRFHQCLTFLYGCSATFLGVFIIAWAPPSDHYSHPDFDCEEVGDDEREEAGVSEEERDRVERGVHIVSTASGGGSGVTRRGTPVVLPGGTQILRRKHSSLGLMGLSPAQHLLLVHTPPRDRPEYLYRDVENPSDSFHRRRAISWFGEERPSRAIFVHRGDETDEG